MTRNPEIGFAQYLETGAITEFGTNVSDKMLLNAAKWVQITPSPSPPPRLGLICQKML